MARLTEFHRQHQVSREDLLPVLLCMFMLLCFHFDLGLLLVCGAPPTTSESGKNASGQEAFGSKAKEVPMEQSPTVSKEDVTSSAVGVGAAATSVREKAGANTTPPSGGEQDDLCMAASRSTPDL
jgi:hypothetical protein